MKNENLVKSVMITLILLVSLSLYCETLALPPSNYEDEDAGSMDNPFLISNLANLRWLSEIPSYIAYFGKHFLQTADIDASETQYWNDGQGFKPIGSAGLINPLEIGNDDLYFNLFSGKFNGNNHTISNLHIKAQQSYVVGLFGATVGASLKIYVL